MKLKYKKAIFIILLLSFGIGLILFASSNENEKQAENTSIPSMEDHITIVPESSNISRTPTQVPSVTEPMTISISPTPTPLPVYPLKADGYPKINSLIKEYYEAKINCDIDHFKSLLSDPSNIPTKEQLQQDTLYIEEYQAIKCYVKKCYVNGAYIVYAYNEIKFINIDTPAPAVDCFYVITNDNDDLKIFSGIFDEVTATYYYSRSDDADVQQLIQDTNAKGEEAKTKDELLKNFWDSWKALQEE